MKRISTFGVKSLLVPVIVFTLSVISCQQDGQVLDGSVNAENARMSVRAAQDISIKGDFEVKGGTLYFRDSDAFVKVHKSLARMTSEERLKFGKNGGFRSLLSFYDEFLKLSEAANDETTLRIAQKKYADIISLDEDKTPIFNVQSLLLASYLDRTGVVYIGKILYKFGDLEQTTVLDGDRAKLNAPTSSIVKRFSSVTGIKKSAGARLASSSCLFFYNKEAQPCSDRKSRLSVWPLTQQITQPNGQYTYMLTPYAIGIPYKKSWGNWVNYSTGNTLFSHWTFSAYSYIQGIH